MDINERHSEKVRTPLLHQGPNPIAMAGGQKRGREEDDVAGDEKRDHKRHRRVAVVQQCAVKKEQLAWNLRIYRQCPYVSNAVSQLSTLTLTGGARITIGDLVDLPDFTASTEAYLMEQLGHALQWIIVAGFIPFCVEPNSEVLDDRVDGNRDVLFDVIEPQLIGSFERYFNPITKRVEMRFIKDWKTYEDGDEDDEDLASQWYVYSVSPPDEEGTVNSAISKIRPEYKALDLIYRPADVDGTMLATHPIPVDEELPKPRGTLVDEDESGRRRLDGLLGGAPSGGTAVPPGFPRLPPGTPMFPESQIAPHEYIPNRMEADRMTRGTGMTKNEVYHIAPGRSHSGVLVPHAFTSISQRVTDYIRCVSSALRVPHHLIDPLRNASSKTGSSALSKHKSSISKAAPVTGGSGGGQGSHAGSNYNADPLFIPALEYRRTLCDFVKTVLALKHGRQASSIIGKLKTTTSDALDMQNKMITTLESEIKKARAVIVKYDPNEKPAGEEKREGEEEEEKKTPSKEGAAELPPLVAPEIEELTRHQESIQANVQLLSDAVQKLSSIKDQRSPFRLKWHQPFLTDTSNLPAIAQHLNMPPEQSSSMFRERLGLI